MIKKMKTIIIYDDGTIFISQELTNQEKLALGVCIFDNLFILKDKFCQNCFGRHPCWCSHQNNDDDDVEYYSFHYDINDNYNGQGCCD